MWQAQLEASLHRRLAYPLPITAEVDMTQDDGHIPNTVEKQIFDTLVKIRQRDSSIYDANKHFFADSADADKPGAAPQGKKPSKPMMLKDVIAQQVRNTPHS